VSSEMALLVIGFVTAALVLVAPGEALAWGPVTHLVHGATVLAHINNLAPALQEILREHADAYLYGCVGADIMHAKKFTRDLRYHCHSWLVGWQVLDGARTSQERAFAYGYLTHLAADTFSHNYYVPLQLIVSFRARALKHVYWEARFDAMQPHEAWDRLRAVVSGLYPECDDHMERIVERTLFSFRTNKRIFNSVMALHRAQQWRVLMQRVGTRSRYVLTGDDLGRYDRLCADAALDLLRHGTDADCVALDPTGHDNLARAEHIRKRLRTLARRRKLTPALQESILAHVVPELKAHIGAT
jgi:Zinc dependent phospholipase C